MMNNAIHRIKINPIIIYGLFCIIYNPPLFSINSMHVVGLLSWVYLIFKVRIISIKRNPEIKFLYGSFLIVFLYLFIIAFISPIGELSILYNPIYFLIDIFPFGFAIKFYWIKKNSTKELFYQHLLFVSVLQSIIALLAFIFPNVQGFLIERFISYGYRDVYSRIASFRMYGFSGGLTFATPIFQSIMAVVSVYYAIKKKTKIHFVFAVLLAASAIINARTSFVVLLVGAAVLIVSSNLSIKGKVFLIILEVILIVFIMKGLFPIINRVSPMTYEWVKSGIDEVIGFISGDRNQGYFTYLYDEANYPIPSKVISFLFGEGHEVFGRESQLKRGFSSDIGYINDLWKGGLCYALFYYSIIVRLFLHIKETKVFPYSFLASLCFFLYPVLMIKGSICNMCDITNAVFLCFIMSC